MNGRLILLKYATVLIAATFVLSSAERSKRTLWKSLIPSLAAPAQPGYLNNGEPFSLREAAPLRPPAYALPPLPITPDPQPLPLATLKPVQPLNPADAQGPAPASPKVTIPAMRVPPIRTLTIKAESNFTSPFSPGVYPAVSGPTQPPIPNAYLNPEILRYFDRDANGTLQSRIRLNGGSLFTLPNLSPLLRRQGSTTYQIK